jgi:neutral ceramidase
MPVQVWRFGRDLTLVTLGGEVVVDYALRLRREYADDDVWPVGYANDVFGYVPSARVLKEGGYEGVGALLYYGRPGPFDATVEDRIFTALARLMRSTR